LVEKSGGTKCQKEEKKIEKVTSSPTDYRSGIIVSCPSGVPGQKQPTTRPAGRVY